MDIEKEVKKYYGETLQNSKDLKTNACCTLNSYPEHLRSIMGKIHDEVSSKYYGCGLVTPTNLEGLRILDLGSGAGRDVYILSALAGETGHVVGVDMTTEQLTVAKNHQSFHAKQFGHKKVNTSFLEGKLEELDQLPLEKNSFDLIVSNCVLNLTIDKEAVLKSAFDLLRPGGEVYFSDIYCDRRIPEELQNDPTLYGECLSGALYWNDFLRLCHKVGFLDARKVESSQIQIHNKEVEAKTAGIEFHSVTYRLFKIPQLEDACEDFGQAILYKGGISEMPSAFKLDDHHVFEKGKYYPVCGNTYLMLKETRLKEYFEFQGDFSIHYGIFEGCGLLSPFNSNQTGELNSCC